MFSLIKKKILGIDISDRSIEIVLVQKEGLFVEIKSKARVTIDRGIVEEGKIKDELKLKLAVEDLLGRVRQEGEDVNEAVFSLPDEICFIHFFEARIAFGDSEKDVVEENIRNIIPVELNRLSFAYKKTKIHADAGSDKYGISLVAVDRSYLERWDSFFKKVGLNITKYDVEGLSQRRCIASQTGNAPFLLVDIGSCDTKIFGFDNTSLLYSHPFAVAGECFTEKIAEEIGKKDGTPVDFPEAEKIKIGFGIELGQEFIWLQDELKKTLAVILSEIEKADDNIFKKTGIRIKNIFLSGGGANLKGLSAYFESILKLKGCDLKVACLQMPVAKEDESIFYIEAVGAAMLAIDRKWSADPFLRIKNDNSKADYDSVRRGVLGYGKIHSFTIHKAVSVSVIFIISILVVIGGLVFYKSKSGGGILAMFNKNNTVVAEREQSLKMSLRINASGNNVLAGEVAGKIIKITVDKPRAGINSYDEIAMYAKEEAEKKIDKAEILWKDAISYPLRKSNLAFPMEFGWLALNADSLSAGALTMADSKFNNVTSVGFKDAVWDKIKKDTSKQDAYILSGIAVFTVKYQKAL